MKRLKGLIGRESTGPVPARPRLQLDATDMAIYAIGDVHGCLDKLLGLERKIVADAESLPGGKLIVMLGDYVDRGPASAQVIAHLSEPPPAGFERICLAGNHEAAMLDYLEGRSDLDRWLRLGAGATLRSYDVDVARLQSIYRRSREIDEAIRKAIPVSDIEFLKQLPVLVETADFIFVHAGFRPDIPLDQQADEDLIWIRDDFYDRAHLLRKNVVHGHTPISTPKLEGRRLNIDSGACFGGPLTAVRIWQGQGEFLYC